MEIRILFLLPLGFSEIRLALEVHKELSDSNDNPIKVGNLSPLIP